MKTVSALAPWFGSNRLLAPHVGAALEGCSWVGVPFAGGMAEIPHIAARTILVNDLHRLVINLARVVADDKRRQELLRRLRRKAFHPDELRDAQEVCKSLGDGLADDESSLVLAEHYFVCCWMNRSGNAGQGNTNRGGGEFTGNPAIRWRSNGGDSTVRYFSAVRGLATFARTLRRCTFSTLDAFDFLIHCYDADGHGLYCDPPFPGAGRQYRHNAGQTDAEELTWHTRLRDALNRFTKTRVVCRFYDHPWIRDLYADWTWRRLSGGKKQSNDASPEVLLVRNGPTAADLFGGDA